VPEPVPAAEPAPAAEPKQPAPKPVIGKPELPKAALIVDPAAKDAMAILQDLAKAEWELLVALADKKKSLPGLDASNKALFVASMKRLKVLKTPVAYLRLSQKDFCGVVVIHGVFAGFEELQKADDSNDDVK
jgi:hypothetical protein